MGRVIGPEYQLVDCDDVRDGTRLTMPDGRSYVVVFDPLGWPWMAFRDRPRGEWTHAADPLGPGWGLLRNDGVMVRGEYPEWDELARTCCYQHG